MSRRRIGQEALIFGTGSARRSALDDLASLIDWAPLEAMLSGVHGAAKGEPAWPPLAVFKALATVIASASRADEEAAWSGHKRRKAIHGFKAHVGADADTAIVEEVSVTPGNANDGRAGPGALPNDPGEVYADSAYRGSFFGSAVRDKGGSPRVVLTGAWGRPGDDTVRKLKAGNHGVNRIRCRIEKIFRSTSTSRACCSAPRRCYPISGGAAAERSSTSARSRVSGLSPIARPVAPPRAASST